MDSSQAAPFVVGQLIFVLLTAVPLAYLVSRLLLAIYLRAVKRSMLCSSGAIAPQPVEAGQSTLAAPTVPLEIIAINDRASRRHIDFARPWRAASIYAAAGVGFAVTLAAAHLIASGLEFLTARFLLVALNYVWPAVLTAGLVAAASWRGWLAVAAAYLVMFTTGSAMMVARSEAFTSSQAILGWLIVNLPPTLLVLAFLAPRIRAVGPMVLAFTIIVVGGAILETTMSGATFLRAIELGQVLGLDPMQALYAMRLASALLVGGLIGWPVLRWLGRLYRSGVISDQSIIIDSIWLLFAAYHGALLAGNNGIRWFLAALAAFVVYKLASFAGFGLLHWDAAAPGRKLLLLRVFSLGQRSAKLFNAFGKLWRYAGSIRLIAGPDLATTTVEPHEFLDFISGKLARRFISGPETLEQRLAETGEQQCDFDGRYRVGDFFCHDDTWKMVLGRLARESDAILMDLRGFSQSNSGCIFEINELLNLVPLDRIVFVVDATTDDAFLRQTLDEGWAALRTGSPNRGLKTPRVQLFWLTGIREGSVTALMQSVAGVATDQPPTHRHAERGPQAAPA